MGNSNPPKMTIGAIGKMLVQLRLMEYGIESVKPLIDSGTDLIAIKNGRVKFIQVKTNSSHVNTSRQYDLMAHVKFKYISSHCGGNSISLDDSVIELKRKNDGNWQIMSTENLEQLWQ